MAKQWGKKQELVLSALNNLILNEPDKVLELYESFKYSSDPDVFKNEPEKLDEYLDGYTPTEILGMLDSEYSFYGDKYARLDGSLESSNDLAGFINFDELAMHIADSENAPKWFDEWVDEDELQGAITDYIVEESTHTEIEVKVRDFVEGYALSINDDWDDILNDWENENEEEDDDSEEE